MVIIIIESNYFVCEVNVFGVEIYLLYGCDGQEWFWNGDLVYWLGWLQIFFLIVGCVYDDIVKIGNM